MVWWTVTLNSKQRLRHLTKQLKSPIFSGVLGQAAIIATYQECKEQVYFPRKSIFLCLLFSLESASSSLDRVFGYSRSTTVGNQYNFLLKQIIIISHRMMFKSRLNS